MTGAGKYTIVTFLHEADGECGRYHLSAATPWAASFLPATYRGSRTALASVRGGDAEGDG